MAKLNDLTGMRVGNWQVLYRNGSTANKAAKWHCKCLLCGNECDVVGTSLTNGLSTKCRKCVPKTSLSKPHRKERIYHIYTAMKQRCYNPNAKYYKDYGGRGITVCGEWKDNPDAFIEWSFANGYGESLTIDRIDNSKGYSPQNCRWVTANTQARNKRNSIYITVDGKSISLSSACELYGVSRGAIKSYRSRHNVSAQEAFDHYQKAT